MKSHLYRCRKHGAVGLEHGEVCEDFALDVAELQNAERLNASAEKVVAARKKDRHERLMDVRVKFNGAFLDPREIHEAVDHLFFEIDLLMHQVEELEEKLKEKKL